MFQGKHIFITGIARGLGKALAIKLAQSGAVISGIDLLEDDLNTTKLELINLGSTVKLGNIDITNREQTAHFVDEARKELGAIFGIINCAGITKIKKATETTYQDYEKVIQINLLGTISTTQLCLENIIATKGFVVSISSIAGYSPLYYRTAYAASKHGVFGYMDSLRSEMQTENVQVLTVCPGYINTKLQENENQFSNRSGESMSTEFVAKQIIQGIKTKKELLLIGSVAKKAYWLHKFFPKLYRKIMIVKTK